MVISLQAFREWAVATSRVANPQVGTYSGQCVSLIQQYLWQVFGVPYAARGNAKDFVAPGFTRMPANTQLLPGDVVRYGSNYGGGYGHIGLIDDNGQWLDQNGARALHVGQRSAPFGGIESVWRPNNAFAIKSPTGGVAEAIRVANVRDRATTDSPLDGSQKLAVGATFHYKRIVEGQTVTQNGITTNKWVESDYGNFVWLGNLKLLS